jgi:hypothetical protein
MAIAVTVLQAGVLQACFASCVAAVAKSCMAALSLFKQQFLYI